jgi:copper chaperone NosL
MEVPPMTRDLCFSLRPVPTRVRDRLKRAAAAAVLAASLAACSAREDRTPPTPREIASNTVCALDGMLLADYGGPKAQVHYADSDTPDFFCDSVEMFSVYLKPEQVRPVRALFVQDMARADWERPRGHWIDARSAWYVLGSRRHGSMGPTIASFAAEADARRFAADHGGDVLPFSGITADKVIIDGGALHDAPM